MIPKLPRPAILVPRLVTCDPVVLAAEGMLVALVEFLELRGHGEAAHAIASEAKRGTTWIDSVAHNALIEATHGGHAAHVQAVLRSLKEP